MPCFRTKVPQIFDDNYVPKDFEVGMVQMEMEALPESNENENVTGNFEVEMDQTNFSLEENVMNRVPNNQASVTTYHQGNPLYITPTQDRLDPKEGNKIANYRESFFL